MLQRKKLSGELQLSFTVLQCGPGLYCHVGLGYIVTWVWVILSRGPGLYCHVGLGYIVTWAWVILSRGPGLYCHVLKQIIIHY